MKPRRPRTERFEHVVEEETRHAAPISTQEALDSDIAKIRLDSSKKSKKSKRESKISAARSKFEEN